MGIFKNLFKKKEAKKEKPYLWVDDLERTLGIQTCQFRTFAVTEAKHSMGYHLITITVNPDIVFDKDKTRLKEILKVLDSHRTRTRTDIDVKEMPFVEAGILTSFFPFAPDVIVSIQSEHITAADSWRTNLKGNLEEAILECLIAKAKAYRNKEEAK